MHAGSAGWLLYLRASFQAKGSVPCTHSVRGWQHLLGRGPGQVEPCEQYLLHPVIGAVAADRPQLPEPGQPGGCATVP
jgi:hypothetical protein